MKVGLTLLILLSGFLAKCQSYEVADIKIGLERGKCYQAVINVDKSTILDSDNRQSYYGMLSHQDPQAAFELSAYPQGQQPASHNRLNVVAYSRNGGYQELALTYRGETTIYYPDRIKSYSNNYGYHFELGSEGGSVVEQLLLKEAVKIDISEMNCGSTPSSPQPNGYQPPPQNDNPNEGCSDLHDAIVGVSSKMYKWPNEDKGKAWTEGIVKKIYDLPSGCKDRDREVNKLFNSATKLYPKFHQDDERYAWFKTMLNLSFERPSNYSADNLSERIDDLFSESSEIFDWHEQDKKTRWLTKKIRELLE